MARGRGAVLAAATAAAASTAATSAAASTCRGREEGGVRLGARGGAAPAAAASASASASTTVVMLLSLLVLVSRVSRLLEQVRSSSGGKCYADQTQGSHYMPCSRVCVCLLLLVEWWSVGASIPAMLFVSSLRRSATFFAALAARKAVAARRQSVGEREMVPQSPPLSNWHVKNFHRSRKASRTKA